MEAIFEHATGTADSLSQSYCIGIQKISGIENATSSSFQVPEKILYRRREAWNNLFEKYSTMVSEVQINLRNLQPIDLVNPPKVMEQRLPMRKPMSMVQYWVDTGNLLHMNCTNSPTHSNSGSSVVEEVFEKDRFEPVKNTDSQSFGARLSAEKYFGIVESSGNKNSRIATSSSSSVDTAVYILSNNNVTKKEETVAIVEGSKVHTIIQIPPKVTTKIVKTNENTEQISLKKENNFEKLNIENRLYSQSFLSKNYMDKITENIKNANFNKTCKSQMSLKLKQQNDHFCSIFFSDSDESQTSVIQNSKFQNLNNNNRINNDSSKYFGRKKLYKRSDSPAEFTPVSEDNLSLQNSRLLLEKYLPLRKSKHPALETPKVSSRFLSRTRFGGAKLKKKLSQHFSLVCIKDNQKTINCKSLGLNQNNDNPQILLGKDCTINSNPMLSQTSSKDDTNLKENDNHNNINILRQSFMTQVSRVPTSLEAKDDGLNSCNGMWKNKFKLTSCKVVVQKLPHKYYLSNLNMSRYKKLIGTVKSKISTQEVNKNSCDHALTSNIASTNNADCFISSAITTSEKTINIRSNNLKIFAEENEKQLLNKRNFVQISDKLKILQMNTTASSIEPLDKTSVKHLKVMNNKELCNHKPKYVLADSSSDESDLIIPLPNIKYQSLTAPRNLKNLSSKKFFDKLPQHIVTKKERCGSFITALNGEHSNAIIHRNDSKMFSCKQKNFSLKFSKCNGLHADSHNEEIRESNISDNCKYKICSGDCSKLKLDVKEELSASSEEEASMPPKKRIKAVDLSKLIAKTTNSVSSECKNFPHNMAGRNLSVNGFHQVNNKLDMNLRISQLLTKCNKTKSKNEMCLSHTIGGNDSSEVLNTLTNSINDQQTVCKISMHSPASKNSIKLKEKNLLPNKQEKEKRVVKVKTTTTRNITTKIQKSFEINLSSDEECIIPLKSK